jgi:hypothetical protein
VTLPLSGDYEITFGATRIANNAAGTNSMLLGLHVNAVVSIAMNPTATSGNAMTGSYTVRQNAVTAAQAADVRYQSASSASTTFANMFVMARPIRVG